ncbi:DUF998 domain-containing protein [Streptomyces bugieae]|uniref:DUF998 domain-containing protein n=1 Tax=Streptomyces bugieae TaxID=3098223 RepID=A0ABU7P2T6_9ACTN|nr:DUF998 domain-containing protein [Streptomyces sp. DSM 41528]
MSVTGTRRPAAAAVRRRRVAAAVLLLGAAAYTAWVLELVLATGLDPVRAYVSELAAADQPLGGLFRATDLTAGLLVLAGALTAMTATAMTTAAGRASVVTTSAVTTTEVTTSGATAPRVTAPRVTAPAPAAGRTAKAGWVALAVFGAATAVDSRLPLSCAPTSDPVCAARETAGLVPATHTAHAVSSTCAMLGALAALLLLTAAARRHDRRSPLARYGPWLVLAELAATCWTLASVAAFSAGRGTWALGAGQRFQVLLVALYLALLALHLARPDRAARTEPVTEAKEIPHR